MSKEEKKESPKQKRGGVSKLATERVRRATVCVPPYLAARLTIKGGGSLSRGLRLAVLEWEAQQ